MNIVILGGSGLVGSALAEALKQRGHAVTRAGRSSCDVTLDFAHDQSMDTYKTLVRDAAVVVNAAGILIEREQRFEDVHINGPRALYAACAAQRVARIVHISGLGLDALPASSRYATSKLEGERLAAAGRTDFVVARLGLMLDAASPATRALARLPGWAIPGIRRAPLMQALALADAVQALVHLCEHPKALRRTLALAHDPLPVQDILGVHQRSLMPRLLARAGAHVIEMATRWGWLDQTAVSVDNLRLLCDARPDARALPTLRTWLGREPMPPQVAFQAAIESLGGQSRGGLDNAPPVAPSIDSSRASRASS